MHSTQSTGIWQSIKLNFYQYLGAQSPDSCILDLLPSRNPGLFLLLVCSCMHPMCQMFMSSVWMYRVAVFCIFLCKAMWSIVHGYYSAGAEYSVALKQFSPPSCIQEFMRKEIYLLNVVYRKKRHKKNMNGKFLHAWYTCELVVRWY